MWACATPSTRTNIKRLWSTSEVHFSQSSLRLRPLQLSPGVEHGLFLMLNIEAYEKMSGPGDTNGVKVRSLCLLKVKHNVQIVIYNQTDIPLVGGLSLEAPPGFLSQLGISMQVVRRVDIVSREFMCPFRSANASQKTTAALAAHRVRASRTTTSLAVRT